ncbi:MAG: SCO family protein [Candidatus Omnitrophica bacterium]|nr:SCO family protein [Candidatus Omnitrophota bacterium]
MKKKLPVIIIIIVSLILFTAFAVFAFIHEMNRPKLPEIGLVKPFELITADGENFYSAQKLNGRVWIADFFFTTCSDICPMMTKSMATLNRSFETVPGVSLVSITVNPEQDTPETLKKYAKSYEEKHNKNPENWYFLTGDREAIRKIVVESFKLGSVEEPIYHSSYFSLVDRNGYIRGYYDGTVEEDVNRLFKDVGRLLKER